MKEIRLWRCEKCGKDHWDRESAEACEKSHIGVKEISYEDYVFLGQSGKYPARVYIRMQDGHTLRYYKEGTLGTPVEREYKNTEEKK